MSGAQLLNGPLGSVKSSYVQQEPVVNKQHNKGKSALIALPVNPRLLPAELRSVMSLTTDLCNKHKFTFANLPRLLYCGII